MKGDWINDKVPDPAPKALPGDAAATTALPLFWDRRYLGGRDGWDLGQPLAPHLPGRSSCPAAAWLPDRDKNLTHTIH